MAAGFPLIGLCCVCVCCVQSIIMPMHNASSWLDECLQAVLNQDFTGIMELSVFDDASTVSFSSPIFIDANNNS